MIFTTLAAAKKSVDTFGLDPKVIPAVDIGAVSNIDFSVVLLIVVIAGAVFASLLGAAHLLRGYMIRRSHVRGGENATVTFMVTVPRFTKDDQAQREDNVAVVKEQIAVAETLYAAIGGLKPQKGMKAWFSGRSDAAALEIVAQDKLVTFYVTVPKFMREFVEQQVHAQWTHAAFEEVEDYNMFSPTGVVVGGYVKFKQANALPVKSYKEMDSDPLSVITNALSKVAEGDGLAIQYLIRPTHGDWRKLGQKIVKKMHEGYSYKEALHGGNGKSWFASKEGSEKADQKRRDRKLTQAEQKMLEGIENKLSKAGLEANIRIVASAQTADTAKAYLNNVLQGFGQYSIYEFGNSFTKVIPRSKRRVVEAFIYRLFSERHRIVVNTEELASLWHLPLPSSETPNIRWMHARTAPAPTNMPKEGLLLGFNEYRGVKVDAFLKDGDRRRHMYIMGKTGTGKSEFIKNLAIQDIRAGKGVCVIDPHGDLADGLLELIPKSRYDDVIYFNPSDMERPMGLNMLDAPNEEMRDFAVQEMISIFYMLFPPEMIGPMFEHQMRNYMLTLMADLSDPGTLVEIPRMIADDAFQKKWVARVKDPVVRSFWEDEMAKTSDYHKSEMMGYLVSKVGRFVENEMMRNIIGQSKSAFNFREIMDTGKILLVNLSKGKTGEVNASLLGLIIVSKIQMAAFTRADTPENERKDFYLYIDEFQNFVTPSISTILSEARKYRLNLIMAHQYMGQLVKDGKTEIRDAVLGNVGSYFTSRIGPEDADVLVKIYEPTFSTYDLSNNDFLTWNAKIIIDNSQGKPFTLKVYPKMEGDRRVGEALKEISRLMYGRDKNDVAADIADRAGIGMSKATTQPPVPTT
ncbi:MAG: type IV secretion system DNA-binding domain-containing protein, partial [Candidatus Uhrbacteria bacterium]|nr:type IV secretion system DNA-binding domain-containing protein [Candidatus Uhrbacteria bacterium]